MLLQDLVAFLIQHHPNDPWKFLSVHFGKILPQLRQGACLQTLLKEMEVDGEAPSIIEEPSLYLVSAVLQLSVEPCECRISNIATRKGMFVLSVLVVKVPPAKPPSHSLLVRVVFVLVQLCFWSQIFPKINDFSCFSMSCPPPASA